MILPTKHILPDRALLGIGAEVLNLLARPMTVSKLWDELRSNRAHTSGAVVDYRWFVLTLDLLFLMGVIEMDRRVLRRVRR